MCFLVASRSRRYLIGLRGLGMFSAVLARQYSALRNAVSTRSSCACASFCVLITAISTALRSTKKEEQSQGLFFFFGAGSRGRTDTVLLPSDFESDASANSTIPAWCDHVTPYIIAYISKKINIFFQKSFFSHFSIVFLF